MPVNRKDYPANWEQIRDHIMRRAGNRCEYISPEGVRCTAFHHFVGYWGDNDVGFTQFAEAERKRLADQLIKEYQAFAPPERRCIWIVLTIAHIHDPNPMNCDDSNLEARCQRHHNREDAPMRGQRAARTRRAAWQDRNREAGQLPLIDEAG